ncbi:Autoinducer 2 sensor kinase/phosphatase LuxQ [Shimia sp. SK013]|uniref:PAS domain-containing hybrid sensor histidine kinase/response regulator n=1 Tax=Shimia sp. SK013 TaxID=1389006 RepID=UPI0006B5B3AD|nr:PAS domain-containing hybrid sensor histidine kinase/response regulator [Shimia sp. SK013]KPA20385.1 Autoinducer 2 sensor kinase/phosphatase LuxQ [Shimia sp. SK013]
MASAIQDLEKALAEFDFRHTPEGKLMRFRGERLKRFYARAALLAIGAVMLAVFVDPIIGLYALLIYAAGDGIESLFLRKVPRLIKGGMTVQRAADLAFYASVIQTLCLVIFIYITWKNVPRESAVILCLSLIGGSTVNAIAAMSLNRAIAIMRMSIFAVAICVLTFLEYVRYADFPDYMYLNYFGAVMLCYLILPFVAHVKRERGKEDTRQRRVLVQSLALAKANESLFAKQKETRRLALVAQRAFDAICLVDTKGRVVWANEAFATLTGYSMSQALGRISSELFGKSGAESESTQVLNQAISEGATGQIVNSFIAQDGSEKWLETSYGPVFDESGNLELMFVIDRDMTDTIRRETELDEARLLAEQGEHAKSSFLATMSHEIRTPMNGIIGMSDLLTKSALSPNDRLYADTIRNSGEALLTIINDILDFSKLNDGHLTIKPITFALQPCLDEVMNLMRPQAKAKSLDLTLDMDPDLPPAVVGDDGRLRQVLINVVGNAIKFTDHGSVAVRVAGRVDGRALCLTLDVQDSGIGIPPDQLEHIFERFAQADTANTRRFGGTGLGLSISRRLARLMSGDITVHSERGHGATFRITIGLGIASSGVVSATDAANASDFSTLEGVHILLAEDNRTNQLVIEKFMQDTRVDLTIVNNGQEAVDHLAQNTPDIVLMDMSMPVMDGLEATRVIRAGSGPQPVIIALTANAFASDRETCLDAGMNGFLSKPVRRNQLLRELTRAKALASSHDPEDIKAG